MPETVNWQTSRADLLGDAELRARTGWHERGADAATDFLLGCRGVHQLDAVSRITPKFSCGRIK
jgi:hypothetical protein